jgi:predicted nicotinamide N-methyase
LNKSFPYTLSRQKVFDLDILLPDPEEVKEIFENHQVAGIEKPFPFWTRVWPSAMAMSIFIDNNAHYVAGKDVLELGAGLAIPSFIASRYAEHVLTSDHIDEAIWLLRKNISELKISNIRAEQMDWNALPEDIHADTVIMSDVNYSPESFHPLNKIIKRYLNARSVIILSTPGRIAAKSFLDFLVPYIAVRETMDISGTQILILVLKKNTHWAAGSKLSL